MTVDDKEGEKVVIFPLAYVATFPLSILPIPSNIYRTNTAHKGSNEELRKQIVTQIKQTSTTHALEYKTTIA